MQVRVKGPGSGTAGLLLGVRFWGGGGAGGDTIWGGETGNPERGSIYIYIHIYIYRDMRTRIHSIGCRQLLF